MRPVADEEVPQRFQRAEEVLANKLWRDQLRDWDETLPQFVKVMPRDYRRALAELTAEAAT